VGGSRAAGGGQAGGSGLRASALLRRPWLLIAARTLRGFLERAGRAATWCLGLPV